MKLLLLDMDGVVFEGPNFWRDAHAAMGTSAEGEDLWRRLARTDYPEMGWLTAKLWQGRSAAPYLRLIAERRFCAGIAEVVAFAKRQGAAIAIVSSGPWHLARRAQRSFGVDAIRANRLGIGPDGAFDGALDLLVDDNHKDRAAAAVQAAFGAATADTALIGDGENDLPVAPLAGTSIGYRVEDARVRRAFDHLIEAGPVSAAVPILARAFAPAPRGAAGTA